MDFVKHNTPLAPDSLLDKNLAMKVSGMTKEEIVAYTLAYFPEDSDSRQKYLSGHINRFLETLNLLGRGNPDQKLLEIGSYDVFTLMLHKFTSYNISPCVYDRALSGQPLKFVNKKDQHTVEYQLAGFNAEKDAYPFEDGMFDVVLFCEVLEHLTQDPLFALSEINRVLKYCPPGRRGQSIERLFALLLQHLFPLWHGPAQSRICSQRG
jgi:SAM-dependent methyltransferase